MGRDSCEGAPARLTGSSRRSRRSGALAQPRAVCATNDDNNTRTIDDDDSSGGDGALHQRSPEPCAPQTTTAMVGHSADMAPRPPRSPSMTATRIATVHFAAVAPSCAPSTTTTAPIQPRLAAHGAHTDLRYARAAPSCVYHKRRDGSDSDVTLPTQPRASCAHDDDNRGSPPLQSRAMHPQRQ